MNKFLFRANLLKIILSTVVFTACDNGEDVKPSLRTKIDYNTLSYETPYNELFVNGNGTTTVDLSEGNARLKMFQALNYQSTSSVAENKHIDAQVLKSMFSNVGNPFYDIETATMSISGAELNSSLVQLKDAIASSKAAAEADAVRAKIESDFDLIEEASHFVSSAASKGIAGKLGTYLVDEKGIEIAQVIQKSLIGALQLDYIGNVLLDEGLTADNTAPANEKSYTALEHNWDEAYGLLTLNPIYLEGSTDNARGTTEFGAGSYLWEYNKESYADIFPAFVKGRAAIVNNDRATLETEATFIRTQFEKALANAALGYLGKWKTGINDASRAHAIGEGLGFIYSLRFATLHGADATFSDNIMQDLVGSENGFWDLDAAKINAASAAIAAKFNTVN